MSGVRTTADGLLCLQEREKLKEEKKKFAERMKLWNKPREDMECEDLKVSRSHLGGQSAAL